MPLHVVLVERHERSTSIRMTMKYRPRRLPLGGILECDESGQFPSHIFYQDKIIGFGEIAVVMSFLRGITLGGGAIETFAFKEARKRALLGGHGKKSGHGEFMGCGVHWCQTSVEYTFEFRCWPYFHPEAESLLSEIKGWCEIITNTAKVLKQNRSQILGRHIRSPMVCMTYDLQCASSSCVVFLICVVFGDRVIGDEVRYFVGEEVVHALGSPHQT
jgi:hypothetical protein